MLPACGKKGKPQTRLYLLAQPRTPGNRAGRLTRSARCRSRSSFPISQAGTWQPLEPAPLCPERELGAPQHLPRCDEEHLTWLLHLQRAGLSMGKRKQKNPPRVLSLIRLIFGVFLLKPVGDWMVLAPSRQKKEDNLPMRNPAAIFLPHKSTETRHVLPAAEAQLGAGSNPASCPVYSPLQATVWGCTVLWSWAKAITSPPGTARSLGFSSLSTTASPALLLLTDDVTSTLLPRITFQFAGNKIQRHREHTCENSLVEHPRREGEKKGLEIGASND